MVRKALVVGWSGVVLASSCLLTSGCVSINATDFRYLDEEEKRFTVQGTPDLTLDTFDGSIDIESWDRPEVLVVVEKRGVDRAVAESIQVEAEQQGDRITVKVRGRSEDRIGFGFGTYRSARLVVSVPKASRIHAKSGDGRIEVRRILGGVSVHTDDGSIRLFDVEGEVEARTDDGSIRVDGVLSQLRLRSDDGTVRVRAHSGSAINSDWSISTNDGSVVVELPAGIDAELDAHTRDGRVNGRDLNISQADYSGHRDTLRGRLGKGGSGRLRVETGDGSITLRSF
jgi:DUF4097 and DUF4098 domain-containing protein YvlB